MRSWERAVRGAVRSYRVEDDGAVRIEADEVVRSPSGEVSTRAREVLDLWFGGTELVVAPDEAVRGRWFQGGTAFDDRLRARFGTWADDASACADFGESAAGRLAAVIVTDQLPRNLHRGQAAAFARDAEARAFTEAAVGSGQDRLLGLWARTFFYLPWEHHEAAASQERSLAAFRGLAGEVAPADKGAVDGLVSYAEQHAAVIARFGRFPGRNPALGRQDTPEEARWLAEGGPTFGQRRG